MTVVCGAMGREMKSLCGSGRRACRRGVPAPLPGRYGGFPLRRPEWCPRDGPAPGRRRV